ncbi:interleukin-15-like isoform X1 [Solea senegalensis]|uniref:Interleukin n=1 Tax=Solea senegalensis TaxID=28829 RepID=A0AAV6Q9Q3_SOLSE|nr:interleukin-15-like isoform X1 [Solea senegalensis]
MTDLMTALIFVQLLNPGDQRAKGIQFQSYNTQVWLCFLIISFLGHPTCAVSKTDAANLQSCLTKLNQTIEKSDAMLYAPSVDVMNDNCKDMKLKCYMWELIMVLNEEEITDTTANCIFEYNDDLKFNSFGCLPCEAYSLQNTTTFLDRLYDLLKEMAA